MRILVEQFDCLGSDLDSPSEGFEVRESSLASIHPEDFLLGCDVEALRDQGVEVIELTGEDFIPDDVEL